MIRGKYLRERKAMRIKRRFKFLVVITIMLIIYKIVCDSFSLYESQAESNANIDIAFFLVNDRYGIKKPNEESYEYTKRINIANLKPGDSAEYTILISNYAFFNEDGEKIDELTGTTEGFSKAVADTDIEYDLKIRATTNLPLKYEFYTGDTMNPIGNNITHERDDKMYFYNIFEINNEELLFDDEGTQDIYKLKITFPDECKDSKYQDIIEYIEISINTEQKIEN